MNNCLDCYRKVCLEQGIEIVVNATHENDEKFDSRIELNIDLVLAEIHVLTNLNAFSFIVRSVYSCLLLMVSTILNRDNLNINVNFLVSFNCSKPRVLNCISNV